VLGWTLPLTVAEQLNEEFGAAFMDTIPPRST
jgi:hypothetical protein